MTEPRFRGPTDVLQANILPVRPPTCAEISLAKYMHSKKLVNNRLPPTIRLLLPPAAFASPPSSSQSSKSLQTRPLLLSPSLPSPLQHLTTLSGDGAGKEFFITQKSITTESSKFSHITTLSTVEGPSGGALENSNNRLRHCFQKGWVNNVSSLETHILYVCLRSIVIMHSGQKFQKNICKLQSYTSIRHA